MLILVDNGLGKLSQSSFPSMLRDMVTQSSGACYLEKHPVGCGLLKLSGGRLSLGAVGEPMAKNNGQDTPVAKKKKNPLEGKTHRNEINTLGYSSSRVSA